MIMIKLLVFLGNPGKEYEKTRHNAGFLACSHLFPACRFSIKFHSQYGEERGFKLIKPMTYMNLSGTAVSEAATFFKLKADEIAIIHDDLELDEGVIKFQKGGGLQGHNGLRSIKERLGTPDFYRIRIGIGRPKHGDVRLYVTSPFTKNELIDLENAFSTELDRIFSYRDLTEAL